MIKLFLFLVRFGKARDFDDLNEETIKKIAVCAGSGIIQLNSYFMD